MMMEKNEIPKISVIVPCYGVEKFLDQCLNSIVNQTLQDIEIILVDDLSPDSVPMLCDQWAAKDKRIKVIHKEKNEGLGMARNTGLDVAVGEYVAFVDSDDFVDISMYERLYEKAKDLDSDVVLCNCVIFNELAGENRRYDVKSFQLFEGRQNVDSFLLDLVAPLPEYPKDVKYMMSVWHGIYRRRIFERENIRFKSEREYVSEDLIFNINLYPYVEKVSYISDCLYYYRSNEKSLSHQLDRSKYEKMKKSLSYVEAELFRIYGEESILRSDRLRFLYFRNFLKKTALGSSSDLSFSDVCGDDDWKEMKDRYPYWRMDIKHCLFFFLVKKKVNFLLRFLVKML